MASDSTQAGSEWPADNPPNTRWPIYTRGNVGEVFPDVVLPLEWDLAGVPSELGWRDGAKEVGFLTGQDFNGISDTELVVMGVFGGYAYFNASLMRLLGVRTPGLSVDVIDTQFLGEANIAPYVPSKGDRNPLASARMVRTAASTLLAKGVPRLGEMRARERQVRASCPNPATASTEQIWGFLSSSFADSSRYFVGSHVVNTMRATIASGALTDLCEKKLGDPNLAVTLTTGIGDVVSAEPAKKMWVLANETDDADFDDAFAAFLDEHGHRGPNEFSMAGRDWAAFPEVAMAAIDNMRGADPTRAPAAQAARSLEAQQAALHDARTRLGRSAGRLDKAIANTALWSRAREESKDIVVQASQLSRHCYLELFRRTEAAGGVSDRLGPLLLTTDEFERYLADPPSSVSLIEERLARHRELSGLEPPFAFDVTELGGSFPPVSTWSARATTAEASQSGTVLQGAAGAPGIARGRARVITDPSDPSALGPGDVLIAPVTDPAWTPLFIPAEAVVVEVGAAMSHSMIVSRELGIPCVVGVKNATLEIPDGTEIEVDGQAGTVRIL